MEDISWKIIDIMFKNNKNLLIKHHIDSYNDFFSKGIINIFKSLNPFNFFKQQIPKTNTYQYSCKLYFGGKNGDKIYYGKPIVVDKENGKVNEQYMYPNIARLKGYTYGSCIYCNIGVIFKDNDKDELTIKNFPKVNVCVQCVTVLILFTLDGRILHQNYLWNIF